MYFKKNISIILILLALVACQKAENKILVPNHQEHKEFKEDIDFLENEYININFPFNSKNLFVDDKFINLNKYPLNQKDLRLFYSGNDDARVLMTTVKKIGDIEYLLGLIVVNFNDYEGGGPAQVIFLTGGKNKKTNYKNTLFLEMGGKFPMLDHVLKFKSINDATLKNYCIKSFQLNDDLSKQVAMKCVGSDPSIEKQSFKFNTIRLGYDQL